MKILTKTELKDAKDHIIALDMMDDYEKLDYLIELQLSGVDIENISR